MGVYLTLIKMCIGVFAVCVCEENLCDKIVV